MKLTAKEREAIEKARKWFTSDASKQERRVCEATIGPVFSFAMGYLAGRRDAMKGKK